MTETNKKNKAPTFSLKDQNGQSHSLSDYLGSYVLVYFYPKDDTPGCTIEANTIKDQYDEFKKLNVKVFGISSDGIESHKAFQEKYNLPFTLLADTDASVAKAYNAEGDGQYFNRVSYLIDPEGNIVKFYPQVNPDTHANEILEDLASIIEE